MCPEVFVVLMLLLSWLSVLVQCLRLVLRLSSLSLLMWSISVFWPVGFPFISWWSVVILPSMLATAYPLLSVHRYCSVHRSSGEMMV